jgi:3-deoxy-D-manno-octulosonic-acid transferase
VIHGLVAYQALVALLLLVTLPWWALFRMREIVERSGGGAAPPAPGTFWVHAASLGEYEAAAPIVEAWAARWGAERLLVTCTNAAARQRLLARLPRGARARIAPLDFWPFVERSLARERPACLLFVETEVWPAWIAAASRRGVRIGIVNGRVSNRTLPRYRRLRALLGPILGKLRVIGCRTEEDRSRWISIGAPAERCAVWGNTKYVAAPAPESPIRGAGEAVVVAAGSMRPGEEAILELPSLFPPGSIQLVLAPRHMKDLPAWEKAALERGLVTRRWGHVGMPADAATPALRRALRSRVPSGILLVDRLGILRSIYRASDAAFVGGSWVPRGGHNLYEPAREGCPVFFGPSHASFGDVAAELERTGGGACARDVRELAARLAPLVDATPASSRMGHAAWQASQALSGAAARSLAGLGAAGFPAGAP